MKKIDFTTIPLRLFCYGTLMRGQRNHERFCRGALSIEEATVRGRLCELPSGIPILSVPDTDIIAIGSHHDYWEDDLLIQEQSLLPVCESTDEDGWLRIKGELMTFADPAQRLCSIDGLEGFTSGSQCLYRRVLIPVYCQDGTTLTAWCYVLGLRTAPILATDNLRWGEDL